MSNFDNSGAVSRPSPPEESNGAAAAVCAGPSAADAAVRVSEPWQRPRRSYPIETKPFFLTSEFVGSVLAIAGIAITAASSDAFGAWRAWVLITAITVGYMISRGIAKSGTRSHADDPREQLDLNWGQGK